ncbi:hypothetical protein [Piscinibacterium candidicorallinum]|uniref:Uncharacterized protein n=1 Tax=Piscinibacterium candidicorallinum TaxID=1793872 RepID=A0ABV7H2W6_9BURK
MTVDWFNVISLLIGVGVSYVIFRLQTKTVLPSYGFRAVGALGKDEYHDPVLQTAASDLVMTYKGEVVPRLAVAEIVFWNAGNAPLRGDDVSKSEPVRLILRDEGRILEARIIKTAGVGCGFKLEPLSDSHPGEVPLSFSHMNPGDGCVLQVLHTAPSWGVYLTGGLVGTTISFRPIGWRGLRHRRNLRLPITLIAASSFLLFAAIAPTSTLDALRESIGVSAVSEGTRQMASRIAVGVMGLSMIFLGAYAIWQGRDRSASVPKGLLGDDGER